MKDTNTKRNIIAGSILASVAASTVAAVYFWKRNRAATQDTAQEVGKNTGRNDSGSAAESYIGALSRLLEEAGISDDRDRGGRYSQDVQEKELLHKDRKDDGSEHSVRLVRNPREGVQELLNEMHDDIDEDLLTNESIAKVVLHLVGLKNLIDPAQKVDIRNIRFINDGKHESMVIDLYTSTYGAPAYDNELARLWEEVFPAEDFWNDDFTKIRINVKDIETDNAIETVSCSLEDVRRYLHGEISEDQFVSRCAHKRARNRKNRAS